MKSILSCTRSRIASSVLLAVSGLASAQTSPLQLIPGIASTFFGTGTTGTSLTQVDVPRGVFIDPFGNLFVADTTNQRILKITPAGVAAVYAGNHTAGFSGDGGTAISAEMHGPEDITMDPGGNLYIADSTNNRIRVVSTAGIINTIAGNGTAGYVAAQDGGPATSAELNTPWGVAVDPAGANLYIADEINDCVRVVNLSTKIITTYAGVCTVSGFTGDGGAPNAAHLNAPKGVYVDAAGDIFICDTGNNRIREVKAGTSVLQSIIGNGNATFNGDGLAPTSTAVSSPSGIAFDLAGTIYFNDGNNRIRRLFNNQVTTLAGTGTAAFNTTGTPATATNIAAGPKVAIDTAGDLYTGDNTNSRIWKILGAQSALGFGNQGVGTTSAAQTVSLYNSGASPVALTGLAITAPFALTPATTCASGASIPSGGVCLISVAFAPTSQITFTGTVTISDNLTTQTIALAGVGTAAPVAVATTLAANLIQLNGSTTANVNVTPPAGVSTSLVGTVTLSTTGVSNLASGPVSATGVATNIGPFGSTLIPGTYPITASYSGNANFLPGTAPAVSLVVNGLTTAISLTVSPASPQILQTETLTATITHATGSTNPSGTVTFYDGTTIIGTITPIPSNGIAVLSPTLSYGPHSITAVYSGDSTYNPATSTAASINVGPGPVATFIPGVLTTLAGTSGTGAGGYSGDGGLASAALLNGPYAVATDRYSNVYIGDCNNNRVRRVTAATGTITTVAGNGTGSYSGDGGLATSAEIHCPRGLAVDAAGDLFIYDYFNLRIREVSAATGIITTFAGNGVAGYSGDGGQATNAEISNGWGLAIDPSGNVYIADSTNEVIRKVSTNGLISTIAGIAGVAVSAGDGGPATSATFNNPVKVTLDSSGNLYIAEYGGNRIRVINPSGSIKTFAGNGTASDTGNGGLATSATIDGPYGLASDAAGDVYIADKLTSAIRMVNSAGIIQAYAGNGTGGYTGNGGSALAGEILAPWDIALANNGNLFEADTSSSGPTDVVREIIAGASVINFGTLIVGEEQPIPLLGTFMNTGGSSMTISSVVYSGSSTFTFETGTPNGCVAGTVLAPGATCSYAVGFTYSTPQSSTGTLVFTDNAGDVPNSTQTVTVSAVTVLPIPAITLVITPPTFAAPTATVTMTATATPPIINPNVPNPALPIGTVTFTVQPGTYVTSNGVTTLNCSGTVTTVGTSPLSSGVATATSTTIPLGLYCAVATYNGSSAYQSAASVVQPYTIAYDFSLSVTPSSANLVNTNSLSGSVTITPALGLTAPIALTCLNVPYNYTCVFGSGTFNSDGSGTPFTTTVTLQYTAPVGFLQLHSGMTFYSLLLCGLLTLRRRTKRLALMLPTVLLLFIPLCLSGCGGPVTSATQATYPISVVATSGVIVHTATINVHLAQQ